MCLDCINVFMSSKIVTIVSILLFTKNQQSPIEYFKIHEAFQYNFVNGTIVAYPASRSMK